MSRQLSDEQRRAIFAQADRRKRPSFRDRLKSRDRNAIAKAAVIGGLGIGAAGIGAYSLKRGVSPVLATRLMLAGGAAAVGGAISALAEKSRPGREKAAAYLQWKTEKTKRDVQGWLQHAIGDPLERGSAGLVNWGAEATEGFLKRTMAQRTQRLEHNLAKITGTVQRHATEAAFEQSSGLRKGLLPFLGGSLSPKEAEKVQTARKAAIKAAYTRSGYDVIEDVGAGGIRVRKVVPSAKKLQLRSSEKKNISVAASALYDRLKAQGKDVLLRANVVDNEDLQFIADSHNVRPEHLSEVVNTARARTFFG